MGWTYSESTSNNVFDVYVAMNNTLNGLSRHGADSAKSTASDQNDGDARGVVFYNADISPLDMPDASQWGRYTWTTGNDYRSMYDGLASALNSLKLPDGTELTAASAYYARITMTNLKDGDATLSIYYPVVATSKAA